MPPWIRQNVTACFGMKYRKFNCRYRCEGSLKSSRTSTASYGICWHKSGFIGSGICKDIQGSVWECTVTQSVCYLEHGVNLTRIGQSLWNCCVPFAKLSDNLPLCPVVYWLGAEFIENSVSSSHLFSPGVCPGTRSVWLSWYGQSSGPGENDYLSDKLFQLKIPLMKIPRTRSFCWEL